MKINLLSFLKNKFPTLSEEKLYWFASEWTIKKELNRSEKLFDKTIYFIESGTLKIVAQPNLLYSNKEDKEVIFGFGCPNQCIFNMPFYLENYELCNSNKSSPFYIEAIKKSHLIGISKEKFEAILEKNTAIHTIWQQNLHSLLLNFSQRELELSTQTSEERYANLIESNPTILQYIPQKYIANYLKMSPETLSRIQSKISIAS